MLFRSAAADKSADVAALAYLAEFYRDANDDTRARPLYQQVWDADKSQYAAAAALGAYRMQAGDVAGAIALWREALKVNPGMVLVRVNLANALWRSGNLEEARTMAETALRFHPASAEARALLQQMGESKP